MSWGRVRSRSWDRNMGRTLGKVMRLPARCPNFFDWDACNEGCELYNLCGSLADVLDTRNLTQRTIFDWLRKSATIYKGPRVADWQTPRWLYDELNARWGPFNLDPCASSDNSLGAEHFFTEEDDGLAQNWNKFGLPLRFFMNPPYGRDIVNWVRKAHEETQRYKPHMMGVGLLPVRTDTAWFHDYILPYYELVFLRGRIAFVDPKTGAPVKGTNFASMLVIYR